jgi:hypothetical protein
MTTKAAKFGWVMDMRGQSVRPATREEYRESKSAARRDKGRGIILDRKAPSHWVDRRVCVIGGSER